MLMSTQQGKGLLSNLLVWTLLRQQSATASALPAQCKLRNATHGGTHAGPTGPPATIYISLYIRHCCIRSSSTPTSTSGLFAI